MIDLTNINHVKALQSNMRAVFDGPAGREVIAYLEQECGWFDFYEDSTERVLIKHGRRGVLAHIKTLLRLKPQEIVNMAVKQREG